MDASLQTGAEHEAASRKRVPDAVRGAAVVFMGAAMMIGMAYGAMAILTSPDGWVMKAANQAMTTAQQGTLASYDIAAER